MAREKNTLKFVRVSVGPDGALGLMLSAVERDRP